MLTVRLIFMTRLDFYYLVNIKTKLINIIKEKAKSKTHAEIHTETHNYYRLA